MCRPLRLALCVVACLAVVSCASERLVGQSGPTPPWASGVPSPEPDRLLFTGQALGVNVLDEANMRSRAMADARRQIAAQIATNVDARTQEVLRQSGSAARGEDDTEEAAYTREVRTSAAERLVGVAQQGHYWEKWHVDPGPFRSSYTRYKYFALASYPRAEYDRAVGRYVRLVTDRLTARQLMEKGQPFRASRVLENLLSDFPEASVSIRLTLADAYERAQMPDRAADVLRSALELEPGRADAVRLRERIEQLDETFPDLSGAAVYVVVDLDGLGVDPAVARAWIEEAVVRSKLRLTGLVIGQRGAGAGATGAAWLVELQARALPPEPGLTAYGVRIEKAAVECSVRASRAGEVLTAASATAKSYGESRQAAQRAAAQDAVRQGLRRCFLALAATRAQEGQP